MGDQDSGKGSVVPESVGVTSVASPQPPATTAQAQVLVDEEEKKAHAYKEIANLLDINENSPIHKLALQEWERKEGYLSNSVSRREGRSAELINHIYNTVGWFAFFQGAVLIAVSQLTQTANTELPLCGKIWSPIVLSVVGTFATIVGILLKFRSLQSLESTVHSERQAITEVAQQSLRLRRDGPQRFRFPNNNGHANLATEPKFVKNRVLVILSVLIFTGICILSYFVILCDTGVVRKWDRGLHR